MFQTFNSLAPLISSPEFDFHAWVQKSGFTDTQKINEIFQAALNELEIVELKYAAELRSYLDGRSLMKPELSSNENFFKQLQLFWIVLKYLRKQTVEAKKNLPFKPPLENSPLYFIGKYHSIIVLREHLGVFPLEVIAVASRFDAKDMQESYLEQFKKWVEKIKKSHSKINVGRFHKGLRSICSFINQKKNPGDKEANLLTLEKNIALIWDIFWREDLRHLEKINNLVQKPIDYEGEVLQVGPKLSGRVYELTNCADSVFWIPPNRAFLALRENKFLSQKAGVKIAQFKRTPDPKGRFALVEKLTPLQLPIDFDDETLQNNAQIQRFVDYIKDFLNSSKPHTDLISLANLGTNQQGDLRVYLAAEESRLTLPALETIIFDFAAGSLTVYQSIIERSGLGKKHQIFFTDILKAALAGEGWFTETDLALYGLNDTLEPAVIKRGKEFFDEILEFKENCLSDLNGMYKILNVNKLKECLGAVIQEAYVESKAVARLWLDCADRIYPLVRKKLELQPLSRVSTPVKKRKHKATVIENRRG